MIAPISTPLSVPVVSQPTAAPSSSEAKPVVQPAVPGGDVSAVSASHRASPDKVPNALDKEKREKSREEPQDTKHSAERGNPSELTDEERLQVEELKQRDREVRAHEAAHMAAAGQYAKGGPSYELTQGPDGKRYAVGGEVSIDTSAVPGDPQATLQKANRIQAAASAPADPSAQDRAVAAQAAQMAQQARQDIMEEQRSETQGVKNKATTAYDQGADKDLGPGVHVNLLA